MPKKTPARKLAKNVKAVAKQTKKTAATISRNVKETLKQGKKIAAAFGKKPAKKTAPKKAPKKKAAPPPPPRPPRPLPPRIRMAGRDSFELTEAPYAAGKTVFRKLSSIERNGEKFDQLKDPDDFWAAEIKGNKTWEVFRTAEQLADKLKHYKAIEENRLDISDIQVLKFHGKPRAWRDEKLADKAAIEKENDELKPILNELYGAKKVDNPKKYKTKNDYLFALLKDKDESDKREAATAKAMRSMNRANKALSKRMAELEELTNKLLAQKQKAKKKAAKKAVKKVATKTTSRKVVSKKAAKKVAPKKAAPKKAAKKVAKKKGGKK